MKLNWNRIVIFGLICVVYAACSPRNIAGAYTKKLGESNYYETLYLQPDGSFTYTSNVYINSNQAPYMPVMSPEPDSIGKGSYELDGKYVILDFGEGNPVQSPMVKLTSEYHDGAGWYKINFHVEDGLSGSGEGLPFVTMGVIDTIGNPPAKGSSSDIDGNGFLILEDRDFPCYLRFSFIGYGVRRIYIPKRGNYDIELMMDDKSREISGIRRFKVGKKEGRLLVDGMLR